jgi:Icc-related predicted phosphoesterase
MFIHAGDITAMGRPENLQKAAREILSLGYRWNIFVPGNHDREFIEDFGGAWKHMPGIIVLQDEWVKIMGKKIYGSSWIKFKDGIYPFEMENLQEKWDKIPSNTDILITHMPPLSGVLDVNYHGEWMGDHDLLKTVRDRVKPKLHIFGHIHHSHGVMKDDNTVYVNGSLTGADRKPAFDPIVVEI